MGLMRSLYTLIFHLILPLILLRLYWRGFKAPMYRLRWQERLGRYRDQSAGDVVWFHAVSVGEAEALFPLIRYLQTQQPDWQFLVTTTTPTGSARVQAVLAGQVEHVYLPYDLPMIIHRFLAHFRPRMAVMLEKEIWPNLFAACAQQYIPLYIINARLSARSARAYQKIPGLVLPALSAVTSIATQTKEDKQHFIAIGASQQQLQVLGNIKFDLTIDQSLSKEGRSLKQALFAGRFVWLVASTHQGEELVFVDSYRQLKASMPELLLLIVPRHPERFGQVKVLCEQQSLQVVMRSQQQAVTSETDVYIADSIGELKLLYAAADLAFVGGSMVAVGGHNVLEPAAIGVPILFGPEMFNFKEIAQQILQADAAIQCHSQAEIVETVLRLYRQPELANKLVSNAHGFVVANQGATQQIADMLMTN